MIDIMIHKLMSWLNDNSDISSNMFDRFMIIIYRLFYLLIRITLGTILGKERRNRSHLFKKIQRGNYVNPSFLSKIYFYKLLRFFGYNKKTVEVYIRKFDYKILCPLNEVDYISLISREESIINRFNPQESDVVVDIGAHLGRYTIISSRRVTNKGKVISIEANPEVFQTLIENIRLNRLDNVITLNYAAYSEKKQISFFVKGDNDLKNDHFGTLMENIGDFSSKGLKKVINVMSNTLDNILLENGIKENNVKWIKIDVEGAEFEVLKGAKRTLSKSTNLSLLIEIHKLSNGGTHYDDIKNFLNNLGFEIEYQEIHETGEAHVIFSRINN
jgi:FkbM family methyltransferase